MRDIPFVDAHVHLWDLECISYPWLTAPFNADGPNGNVELIAKTYLPLDYLMETARWRVVGYVHVEAGANLSQALTETKWLSSLNNGPSGIVSFAALEAPDLERLLASHVECGHVRGIRQIVNWHPESRRTYTPRDLTIDPGWERGFALLSKYGLSFDLQCYPAQMRGLAELLARHPDVPVIVNHLGMPVLGDVDGLEVWRAGLRALSALPQVAIKISGLGFAIRGWTSTDARPLVLTAIDLFGPERCLVASDLPTDRLFGSFDRTLGAYAEIIMRFSEPERRAMWGRNANRIYRLGLDL